MNFRMCVSVSIIVSCIPGSANDLGPSGLGTHQGVQASDTSIQPPTQSAPLRTPAAPPPSTAASTSPRQGVPSPSETLVFSDLPNFDSSLAKSLTSARETITITSADRVTLRQMPTRLEKWLAAVDDGGGKIETVPLDTTEPQSRSLTLIFSVLGAIRTVRDLSRTQQYVEARKYDAKIFYRSDSSGDRIMDRIELVRRPR